MSVAAMRAHAEPGLLQYVVLPNLQQVPAAGRCSAPVVQVSLSSCQLML